MGPTLNCCHGNEIWARRGDPVAYRLVYYLKRIGLFVHDARSDFSKSASPIFTKFGADVQHIAGHYIKFGRGYGYAYA